MPSASQVVKMALVKADKKQKELSGLFGENRSTQSISNKIRFDRWTANDLALVAELTGAKLAFIYPDGQTMVIDAKHAGQEDAEPAKEPSF